MSIDKNAKVAVLMGSDDDYKIFEKGIELLKEFEVQVEVVICSVNKLHERAIEFAKGAEANGIDLIIAGAEKAGHLPGTISAFTPLPVIGVPIKSSELNGMDSLYSVVQQMPEGNPVATVAVDGTENAALLAVQILSIGYDGYRDKMKKYKSTLAQMVRTKDAALQEKFKK